MPLNPKRRWKYCTPAESLSRARKLALSRGGGKSAPLTRHPRGAESRPGGETRTRFHERSRPFVERCLVRELVIMRRGRHCNPTRRAGRRRTLARRKLLGRKSWLSSAGTIVHGAEITQPPTSRAKYKTNETTTSDNVRFRQASDTEIHKHRQTRIHPLTVSAPSQRRPMC